MYHLTTCTGLTLTTPDPATAVSALRIELDQYLAAGAVNWTIAVDGRPDPHMGRLDVPELTRPGTQEFVTEHLELVLANLTADSQPAGPQVISSAPTAPSQR